MTTDITTQSPTENSTSSTAMTNSNQNEIQSQNTVVHNQQDRPTATNEQNENETKAQDINTPQNEHQTNQQISLSLHSLTHHQSNNMPIQSTLSHHIYSADAIELSSDDESSETATISTQRQYHVDAPSMESVENLPRNAVNSLLNTSTNINIHTDTTPASSLVLSIDDETNNVLDVLTNDNPTSTTNIVELLDDDEDEDDLQVVSVLQQPADIESRQHTMETRIRIKQNLRSIIEKQAQRLAQLQFDEFKREHEQRMYFEAVHHKMQLLSQNNMIIPAFMHTRNSVIPSNINREQEATDEQDETNTNTTGADTDSTNADGQPRHKQARQSYQQLSPHDISNTMVNMNIQGQGNTNDIRTRSATLNFDTSGRGYMTDYNAYAAQLAQAQAQGQVIQDPFALSALQAIEEQNKITEPRGISIDAMGNISINCPICLEMKMDLKSTICGHVFCSDCVSRILIAKPRCPLCRTALRKNDVHKLYLGDFSS